MKIILKWKIGVVRIAYKWVIQPNSVKVKEKDVLLKDIIQEYKRTRGTNILAKNIDKKQETMAPSIREVIKIKNLNSYAIKCMVLKEEWKKYNSQILSMQNNKKG